MAPSLVQRFFGSRALTGPVSNTEPKSLLETGPKRLLTPETKASSFALLPKGAYGATYSFFSPDGGRTMIDLVDGATAFAFVAYWYVATRWRAQKIAEAPLMVIHEDQVDGTEEWIPKHELVPILEDPSIDYDMGELLEITSHHLDNTGGALWTIDRDNATRIARLTPFSRNEFEILRDDPNTPNASLFSVFRVQTANGPEDWLAEDVCFFKDVTATMTQWGRGKSRLDVALQWLNLGERARKTIYDLLGNSVWPSIVISPDKDWNPDPKTYEEYRQQLELYARQGNKGKPFVALGGAGVQSLASSIKDLVPTDILNRVESLVAAISGVPAVVLQYQIGLENSPWSQMGEARKMAYDDTISPSWRRIERVLTKQILRPMDDDPTHFIRFDTTNIEALQRDQLEQVQIAVQMGRAATLNERRAIMGLEPATPKQDPDKKADDIPELSTPDPMTLLAGGVGGKPGASTSDTTNGNEDAAPDPADKPKDKKPKDSAAKQAITHHLERKFKAPALLLAFREEAHATWKMHVSTLLTKDADEIAGIVETYITEATEQKSIQTKARQKDRAMAAITRYLNEESRKRWTKSLQPLMVQASQRGGAVIAADLNVSYGLLHPHILSFAKQTSAEMITGVSNTTKGLVSDIIQGGLDANAPTSEIARLIREATGFSKSRSELIARTETTKAFNGAPEQSLAAISDATGRTFTKTWSGALDDRERDEHVAMEGETVEVGDAFSNGLDFPSEPNCRCTVLFNEVEA